MRLLQERRKDEKTYYKQWSEGNAREIDKKSR